MLLANRALMARRSHGEHALRVLDLRLPGYSPVVISENFDAFAQNTPLPSRFEMEASHRPAPTLVIKQPFPQCLGDGGIIDIRVCREDPIECNFDMGFIPNSF